MNTFQRVFIAQAPSSSESQYFTLCFYSFNPALHKSSELLGFWQRGLRSGLQRTGPLRELGDQGGRGGRMGGQGWEGGGVKEGIWWLFYQLRFTIKKYEEPAKKEQQEEERLASSDLAGNHFDSSLLLHKQDKTVLMFTLVTLLSGWA